jgi:hypothetical protein
MTTETFVTIGDIRVSLETFNGWIQSPLKVSRQIRSLKQLQQRVSDAQERMAIERKQIRALSQEVGHER